MYVIWKGTHVCLYVLYTYVYKGTLIMYDIHECMYVCMFVCMYV